MSDFEPLVIDNGSGVFKAGFAGYNSPGVIFQSVVGRLNRKIYVGNEIKHKRGLTQLNYPIERGNINNWDDVQILWNHAYNLLKASPLDHLLLLTETPTGPRLYRELTAELFFENFNVPGLYLAQQGLLALYSAGRTTGIVLDSGDHVTHTTPVLNCNPISHATLRFNLGGKDLTEYLGKLLVDRGYYFTTSSEKEILRDIKEKLGYVTLNFEEELNSSNKKKNSFEKVYELPDGQLINIDTERFKCAEVLFQPNALGIDAFGIHEEIYHSIAKSHSELRKELYENIILSGGNTMFPGLVERLKKELITLTDNSLTINVIASENRFNSVWNGGSILASLSVFEKMCVSRAEYREFGSSIVHQKCF